MIDYARPFEQSMCEYLPPTPPAPARLDDFQVFKKVSYAYDPYYRHYDGYEPEVEAAVGVYHDLVSARDYRTDQWKYRAVTMWTEEDTISWVIDCALSHGYNEYDVPVHNFRVPGLVLRDMRREDLVARMAHARVDPLVSRSIADTAFEVLRARVNDEMLRPTYRYEDYPNPESQVLDLDTVNHRGPYTPDYRTAEMNFAQADSSDDAEDALRSSETASPDGSDESKSGDEEDKRKIFKRPPGRPKGTGRKVCKRPRSVSVPEFLRNLLFDEKYCPSIIKWEDHSQGKFR